MKRGRLNSPSNINQTTTILDKFSDTDLRAWENLSEDLDEFNIRLFYHLEALRTLHKNELCEQLGKVKRLSLEQSGWCRIVDYQYSHEPLSAKGSVIKGGRFNIGSNLDGGKFSPFPVLYVADHQETAYIEKFGVVRSAASGLEGHELALKKTSSYSVINIDFNLGNVFDLSLAANLKGFVEIISKFTLPTDLKDIAKRIGRKPPFLVKDSAGLKAALLDEHWQYCPSQYGIPASSQIFGRLLKEVGFEAVLYPSTKKSSKKCIAVFLENLSDTDSFVRLSDAAPPTVKYTELNSANWQELSQL